VTGRGQQHYPPELRERAVRMVAEVAPNYDSQWAAITAVAQKPRAQRRLDADRSGR